MTKGEEQGRIHGYPSRVLTEAVMEKVTGAFGQEQ